MSAQFVVTSRLNNILQMISLARQTGILRVIRGQGATREMGQIRFIDGQPVSALLGQLTGEAALGVLNNWGECYYAFDELAIADVAASLGPATNSGPFAMPPDPAMSGNPISPLPGGVGDGWGQTPPYGTDYNLAPGRPVTSSSLSDTSWPVYSYQQSGLFSGSGPAQPTSPYSASPLSPTDYGSQPSSSAPSFPLVPSNQASGQGVSTMLLTSVPRRTALAERIEHLPLDRRERMVLLLVDGQRSFADLARLTRRTETEVQAVLTHLELLGLITLPV